MTLVKRPEWGSEQAVDQEAGQPSTNQNVGGSIPGPFKAAVQQNVPKRIDEGQTESKRRKKLAE